jgi:NAD-dependent histone deacetylase SIR2
MFDSSSFLNPKTRPLFLRFIAELKQKCDNAVPSLTHRFIKQIAHKGMMLRNYTQNIDGLEKKAGLKVYDTGATAQIVESVGLKRRESLGEGQRPTIVPLHGTLEHLACTVCRHRIEFDGRAVESLRAGELIECIQCKVRSDDREQRGRRRLPSGIYRPDIVLYNEHHPMGDVISDFVGLDLDQQPTTLIVMGTSLRVPGLKRLVKDMAKAVQRKQASSPERSGHIVFINKTPLSRTEWRTVFDIELIGTCDEWIECISSRISGLELGRPQCLQLASPASVQKKITTFFKTRTRSRKDKEGTEDTTFDVVPRRLALAR